MTQGGLPSAAIDGLPTGTIQGRGHPKLCWIDNVTQWSGRHVGELRRAAVERKTSDGDDSRSAPPLEFED